MKQKIIIPVLFISLFSLLCTGCIKENNSNSNPEVYTSGWYTPTAWGGQSGDWYFDIQNSGITNDIIDNGVILAYMSVPNDAYDGAVRPLPAYALGSNWDFLIPGNGEIEFTCDSQYRPGITGYNFRFIVIPAGYNLKSTSTLKSATVKNITVNDLKTMPYKDVCKILNIPE